MSSRSGELFVAKPPREFTWFGVVSADGVEATLAVWLCSLSNSALNFSSIPGSTNPNAASLITDAAINKVTSLRGRFGAFQHATLETNMASLKDTITNLTETQSSIRDADFAKETAALTRAQILVQSGTAVLQIDNQKPQQVLALLRG